MKLFKILKRIFIVLLVLILSVSAGYTYFISPNDYKFSTYSYTTDKIPSEFDHFKIAFFSDCNISSKDDITRFEKIIKELNNKTFDMVIFGGDLFEDKPLESDTVSKILKSIDCKYGKFAVLGDKDSTLETTNVLNKGGFEVLDNHQRTIYYENKTISLLGLNNKEASSLINDSNKNLFQLAINHQPDSFDDNYKDVNLQLSGHSLGGSIYFPFLGSLFTDTGFETYNHDIYTKSKATLYVTNGLQGTSKIPYKFFASNEIKFITLVYEQATLE